MSNRDSFWGAKPNQGETTLIGINILGQLLTSLRDELRRQKGYTGETVTRYLTGVKTNTLVINGKTVIGKDSEWPVNFLMVAHGWAYHYKEPSAMRNHCLLEAERIAKDALRLGAISFYAVKHLVLCRLEGRPPRLDLELYPYLPRVRVSTTSAGDYMTLLSGRAA